MRRRHANGVPLWMWPALAATYRRTRSPEAVRHTRVSRTCHRRTAYQDAIARAAQAGDATADAIVEAKRAFDGARDLAESEVHGARLDAATNELRKAESRYRDLLDQHWAELFALLSPAAEDLAARYRKVQEETARKLAPIREQHGRLRTVIGMIVGGIQPIRPEHISGDPCVAPLPPPELIARALPEPQPEQLAPIVATQEGS